ncbi:MAG: helix-turn-helix domain-containing protein, partial [Planctomycetota bacterium]
MGLRELKRQKLLDAILDETCALIEEVGYESLQVEEVVRRLEISKPTFYRYFESKADVLCEVQLRMTRAWTADVAKLADAGAPFAETLDTLARNIARELLEEPELNRAVYRHASTVPSPRVREAED